VDFLTTTTVLRRSTAPAAKYSDMTAQAITEVRMPHSKRIAGLVGPTIVAMIVAEFPLVQPHLYDAQIPPVVYLSGVLMFVAGLAIARAHNRWARDWTVLVTLSGWFFLGLGLFRMFAAGAYQRGSANTRPTVFMVLEGVLLVCGLVMTFKAYSRNGR
jgi:hypothetical protein